MSALPKKVGDSVQIEVDGKAVTLTRIDVRRYDFAYTEKHERDGGHPKEQCLLEIRIGDDFVGMATRPFGWGKQEFAIDALWNAHRHGWPTERRFGGGYNAPSERLYDAGHIAAKAVELRGTTMWGDRLQLMTADEIKKSTAAYIEEEKQREAESEANSIRWAAERAAEKQRNEDHRDEVLAGLTDIGKRTDLSNLERAAIVAAIARYEGDRF